LATAKSDFQAFYKNFRILAGEDFLTIKRTCLDPKHALDRRDRFGHGRKLRQKNIVL
jgi:hypothetical protein